MVSIFISFLLLLSSFVNSYADTTYTIEDIQKHNSENDCWVVFEESVYDITKYVKIHDRYMDIRSWCGGDMTQAFKTKDNTGRDHKRSSYSLLETFRIGVLSSSNSSDTSSTELPSAVQSTEDIKEGGNESSSNNTNEYNIVSPILLTVCLYWIPYFFVKKKRDISLLKKFNGFWNTLLILLLLIPSFGFGIFMIVRYTNSSLWNISFDFLYWHVELSLVMGMIAISHFIQRIKMFMIQIKRN